MDLLENIVFPQSPSNILLLKYLLFLSLLILLPYLSVLIGSTFFSIMHFIKGKNLGSRIYLKFANELIDLVTPNRGMSFSLGVVPILSIMFIFGQLLLNSGLNINMNLLFVLILFVISAVYVYTYKYSFRLKNIFNLVNVENLENNKTIDEFKKFNKSNSKILANSGIIGLLLLLLVSYLLISILQVTFDSSEWIGEKSLFTILLSVSSILYYLFYIAFSFALTCSVIMFKFFKNNSPEYSLEYKNYIKSFTLKTGLIFTSLQPLLFVLSVLENDRSAISFQLFIATSIILILMLLISIIIYFMYKESKTHLNGSLVFVFLILVSVIIYKDQMAFETTSAKQIYNLGLEYNLFAEKLKEEAGIFEIAEVNGEDIYNAKCIACHKFDSKLVGPAYNDVLPKYDGKRQELVDFILSPQKINPEFTAMPNQGLKPREAEAIADYIVKIYKGE
jgi:cytochrome c